MDGDLQNDPSDIPRLLAEIDKGADVVSGWRRKRRDPWLSRQVPSKLGNWFVAWQTGVKLHDFGCGLKAYRSEIIKSVRLYGEMHRLIPALTAWMGAKLVEVEVNHRARSSGKSKYHVGRVFAVILDILSLKFFSVYAIRPTHAIGLWGIMSIFCGVLSVGAMMYLKWGMGVNMTRNPFLVISVLLFIVGMQLIVLGLLGEVNVRTYYEMQEKEPYRVKETRTG
jgi:glycosyltransferase involved in cell wall biosynthesis